MTGWSFEILNPSKFRFDMWTRNEQQNQQQDTFTHSPSLLGAIKKAFLGLATLGPGLMGTAGLFTGGDAGVIGRVLIGGILGPAFLYAGGLLEWRAYKAFRRWQTFDTSSLQMETVPVPLGTTLRACVQVPISPSDQPINGFQIGVAAYYQSSDDKDKTWEGTTSVRGQPGEKGTVVSFSLDLPVRPINDLQKRGPFSLDMDSLEKFDWTLTVTASFEDKADYKASFDLPVSVPDDLGEQAGEYSEEDPAVTGAPADTTDEALWDVDGEQAGLQREEVESGANKTESEEAGSNATGASETGANETDPGGTNAEETGNGKTGTQ